MSGKVSPITSGVQPDVILRAQDLCKEFVVRDARGKKERFTAVQDVRFEVRRGRTLGIVGESGSGKSTTARMIARLLDATSGTIEFEGTDVTRAGARELTRFRQNVQVVFQDPFSSLNPRHTIEKIVAAPLYYQGMNPPGGVRNRVRELLDRVGLNPDHAGRFPRQFSGGQAQRIGIARALAVNPQLVICDEAVSALDVSVQAVVINLLKSVQQEYGLSYVFIAHDLAVVRQVADDVVVMRGGQVMEQGGSDDIFDRPRHEYTKQLLAAVPRINPEWDAARATMLASEAARAKGEEQ